jgi:hypothetical protein
LPRECTTTNIPQGNRRRHYEGVHQTFGSSFRLRDAGIAGRGADSADDENDDAYPRAITTPDSVETRLGAMKFTDGFPDDATTQKVYDNLDFMNGVNAFLNAIPGASVEGLRAGFASQGADNNQTVLIMENLMDSKSLFLTANTDSVYNLVWLDTKAGPVVIETPPNVLGVIDDHWFQYVADFGRVGPDKGKGGKFLLLPPGYKGDVPNGYFVLRSRTYGSLVFWRGFLENGSTKTAVDNTRKFTKVYRLSEAKNPPQMKFVNVSGTAFNTIGANTYQFYEDVNAVVQYEPNEAYSPEILGTLAAIGIEKGKTFAPDERMKKVLTEATAVKCDRAHHRFQVASAGSRILPEQRVVSGLYRRQLRVPQPTRRTRCRSACPLHLLRHRRHARDGAEDRGPRLTIRRSHYRRAGQAARWQQDLQDPSAAQHSGQGLLVVCSLRQPKPFDAADRPAVSGYRQRKEGPRHQPRHIRRRLVRTERTEGARGQLGTDHPRQGLERSAAPLWPRIVVVRQDMEAGRVRGGGMSL